MAQTYFLIVVLGAPLSIFLLAILAAVSYRGDNAELLDWRPTRSPQREVELERDEVAQMLAAQNRYRRRRGAPERSLDELVEHPWASELSIDTPAPPDDSTRSPRALSAG